MAAGSDRPRRSYRLTGRLPRWWEGLAEGADAYARFYATGPIQMTDRAATFAGGVACREPQPDPDAFAQGDGDDRPSCSRVRIFQPCCAVRVIGRTSCTRNSPARSRLMRLVSSDCHRWNAALRVVTQMALVQAPPATTLKLTPKPGRTGQGRGGARAVSWRDVRVAPIPGRQTGRRGCSAHAAVRWALQPPG